MSNREEQMVVTETETVTETKPRIMTGYIHYGESDDLTKLFDILKEFKNNNGLKYSHQSKAQMVFFNISTEHLDALSKVRPFKISKFKTTTEYKCDENTSLVLMGQKDSFLRMIWNGETETVSFLSRTPSRVHGNLVRRIFRDSGVEFQQNSYSVQRNFDREGNGRGQGQDQDQNQDQDHDQTAESTHEGFQRVEKKFRKPRTYPNHSNHSNHPNHPNHPNSKVVKETDTKPKFRGGRTSQTPRTNV